MSSLIDDLIAQNDAARESLSRQLAQFRAAFDGPPKPTVAPLETAPVAWLARRDAAERVSGCTIRRYFAE